MSGYEANHYTILVYVAVSEDSDSVASTYSTWSIVHITFKEAPYRIAGKIGGSVIYINQRQIEIRQNFLLAYIHMTIPC